MITLLTNLSGAERPQVTVLLDIRASDLGGFNTDPGDLLATAKRAKRKVGCVQRRGSEIWFTYDLALQASMEAHLLGALVSSCGVSVTTSIGSAE